MHGRQAMDQRADLTSDGSPLPPPPPPVPPQAGSATTPPMHSSVSSTPVPSPGQLTPGWRLVTAFVWALAFVALVAVSKTSRELGLATWWLNDYGRNTPVVLQYLPFVPPLAVLLAVVGNVRWVPWAGLAAAAALAAVGLRDLGIVTRLGVIELAIAGAGALAAIASFGGRYRAPVTSAPNE